MGLSVFGQRSARLRPSRRAVTNAVTRVARCVHPDPLNTSPTDARCPALAPPGRFRASARVSIGVNLAAARVGGQELLIRSHRAPGWRVVPSPRAGDSSSWGGCAQSTRELRVPRCAGAPIGALWQ